MTLSRQAKTTLINQQSRRSRHLTRVFGRELQPKFEELGRRAARIYLERARPKALEDLTPDAAAAQIAAQLHLEKWEQEVLRAAFAVQYKRVGRDTVRTINDLLDLGVMLPDSVEKAILARGGTRAGLADVDGHTREAIRKAIAEGREKGQGPKQIARSIRDKVPAGRYTEAGAKYRAEMIARAETKFAQNASSLGAYKHSDVVRSVQCFDARNGRTHASACLARAGATFTFEAAEREDLTHPNCSLSWAPNI